METPLIVNLENPTAIKRTNGFTVTLSQIKVYSINEDYSKKIIIAKTNIGNLVLWKNAEYDNIGVNWTDDLVKAKIKQIVE